MIRVMLADTCVDVRGWTADMDQLGEYTLKRRKSPEEVRAEKDRYASRGYPGHKVKPYTFESHSVLSCDKHDMGHVKFLPGLWPCVKGYLDRTHREYEIEDRRMPELRPEPDYSLLSGIEFRPGQAELLCQIVTGDCGICAANVGFGKSFLIALLCKIYTELRIVVTSNSVTVVKQLYKDIAKECPGQTGILCGEVDKTAGCRIIVSTVQSLLKVPEDKVQLLLVDECHFVGDNEAARTLARFRFCRRFGFSATPVRNDGTGKVMEALLGPVIMRSTYQESVENKTVTPIKYTLLECSTCPDFLKQPGMAQHLVQQWGYYRNNARNRAIANFVKLATEKGYDGQILIIVNTTEHLIALHQLLPGFVATHAEGSFDPAAVKRKFAKQYPNLDVSRYVCKAKDNERALAAFAKGTLKRLISTKIVRQGLNFSHLRLLIRADGVKSEVDSFQIPGRLSRLDKDKDWAYLVDFDDTFLPAAHNKSLERKKLYDSYGWQQITPMEAIDALSRIHTTGAEPASGPEAEEAGCREGVPAPDVLGEPVQS